MIIMRPQHYGDTRKVKANFAFKEEKTAQETNTWAGEGGGDRNQGSPLAPFDGRRQLN